jgi:hypothetical protein
MALTTVQFWQQQLDTQLTAQAAGQSTLQAAQAMQKESAALLSADLAALDAGAAKIAAQRAKLAVTTIPAEADALVKQITQDVIAQRTLQGTLLDHKEQLDEADAQVAVANAALARTAGRVTAARAAVAKAAADRKQREMLKAAVAAPPLLTIAADAAALLTDAIATNAQARMDANFPTTMQAIAKARVTTWHAKLKKLQEVLEAARDAQAAGLVKDNGRSGVVHQAWLRLQRAQAALAAAVATAASRYAKARSLLQRLAAIELAPAGTVPDVLTQAEKAATRAALDDEAAGKAQAAVEALETAKGHVIEAQGDLEIAIITGVADLTKAREAVATAKSELAAALPAAAANKDVLDQWEAVVPDPAWGALLDYIDGLAALDELKGVNLDDLSAELEDAESDYTTALDEAETAQRDGDGRADTVALYEARESAALASIGTRLASAVRGDSD